MAKATVELLLENLKQLLIHHAHLIPDAVNQAEKLENSISLFRACVVPKERREDEEMRELIRRIRRAVYVVEDIVDAYVIKANDDNFHDGSLPEIADILKEVDAAVDEYDRYIDGLKSASENDYDAYEFEVEDAEQDESEKRRVEQMDMNYMVGFQDEMKVLKNILFEESGELDVISIVGFPGLGKTTLAKSIFDDPDIRLEFPTRVWVYVSHGCKAKEIFLDILEQFTIVTEDVKRKKDEELANLVVGYLENERFLIVMDDVWSCEDWDALRVALPKSNMGKVLITSRQLDVGRRANPFREPHMLRFLNVEESFRLLQHVAFGDKLFPTELEYVGHQLARKCYGDPLSVLLIGGVLVYELSSNMAAIEKYLEDVRRTMDEYDPWIWMGKIIEFSYRKLPHHLKDCFLYFGMFVEDFEIPVWKLIRLWIAEGFIPQKSGVSLEETAENYLEELIIRNLVRAEKFKLDGKVKTCRIHDMLRHFCIAEAGNKNESFLQEMRFYEGIFQPSVLEESMSRRLSIYSNVQNFLSMKPYRPNVGSFVCSSRDENIIPMEDMSAIPKGFKQLRVLDVKPIKFIHKLPRDMFKLYHLRYLVLSLNLRVLPSAFSKLWNIQTLEVNTTSRTLEVRVDLLNLTRLMHFKTNASAALLNTSRSSKATGGETHAIGNIAPESCTQDFFDRVPNAKRLGVRGKLALLLDVNNQSLDSLGNLRNLEKLKLLNDVYPVPPSGAQLYGLPPASKFPPKLKILTLSRTSLDWCHMSVLGSLECLEVLKVKDKAFVGDKWVVTDGGFLRLEVLHIERTNLKIWLASNHHFPSLKHLQLKHCDHLENVPMELADVLSFTKLDLFHCKRAAGSALQIEEKKRQEHDNQFKLSVFPLRNAQASF